jgi:hypothetical protein
MPEWFHPVYRPHGPWLEARKRVATPARGGRWAWQTCDHSRLNIPPALGRAACARCLHPRVACLCALAPLTAHRTEVLVLQHPQKQRQAKNSVALLRL